MDYKWSIDLLADHMVVYCTIGKRYTSIQIQYLSSEKVRKYFSSGSAYYLESVKS